MFETLGETNRIASGLSASRRSRQLHAVRHKNLAEIKTKPTLKPIRYKTISDRSSCRYFIHFPVAPEQWLKDAPGDSTSLLRAECLPLLRFDLMMDYYQLRPVKIPINLSSPRKEFYQPLFLLTYRRDIIPALAWQPVLADIWSRRDLIKNWNFFSSPFYQNARFLLPFMKLKERGEDEERLYRKISELKTSTVAQLLKETARDNEDLEMLKPSLWRMIALYDLRCDLQNIITMKTQIWRG
jgi:hypothetical protein